MAYEITIPKGLAIPLEEACGPAGLGIDFECIGAGGGTAEFVFKSEADRARALVAAAARAAHYFSPEVAYLDDSE